MSQAKKLISGTLILSIAGILAKFCSMFFKIPIIYLTGNEGNGYYQVFYPTFIILISFSTMGMPYALSKLVSENVARGHYDYARNFYKIAHSILIAFGLITTVGLLLFTPQIIDFWAWDPGTRFVMYSLAASPLFVGISGAIRGYFQGMQQMKSIAVAQIIENFTKVIVGISLTYILLQLGFSIAVSVGGAAIGTTVGYLLSTIFLLFRYRRKNVFKEKLAHQKNKMDYKAVTWKLMKVAIPVTIGVSSISIMNWLDTITLFDKFIGLGETAEYATIVIGQIGKTFSVVNVPLTIALALMTSTIPAISEAVSKKNKKELHDVMHTSIRLSTVIAFPAAVGLIVLAEPIMRLIYPRSYDGHEYLMLFGICFIFLLIGQTMASILQGMGHYYLPILAIGCATITKLILNGFLINESLLGLGALIGSIGFYLVLWIVNWGALYYVTKIKIPVVQYIIKPLFSSMVMGLFVYLSYQAIKYNLALSNIVAVLVSIGLGIFVYALGLCLLKGISEEDLSILPKSRQIINLLKRLKLL